MYDAAVLRIVFAEDNYLVREGTSALLQSTDEVELIGTASSFDELMTAASGCRSGRLRA